MISVEKPGTPGELVHFGVKGMKWGVRKAADTAFGTKSAGRSPKSYKSGAAKAAQTRKGPTSSKLANLSINSHYARSSARTQKRKAQGKTGPKPVARAIRRAGQALDTTAFVMRANTHKTQSKIATDASEKLMKSMPTIKARHGDYAKMSNRMKHPFSKEARAYRKDVKQTYLRHLEKTANSMTNKQGTWQYTLKDNDGNPNSSKYMWEVAIQPVKTARHADDGGMILKVKPIFDDEGWIVDLKVIDDENEMAQTMDLGANFLMHMGVEV